MLDNRMMLHAQTHRGELCNSQMASELQLLMETERKGGWINVLLQFLNFPTILSLTQIDLNSGLACHCSNGPRLLFVWLSSSFLAQNTL